MGAKAVVYRVTYPQPVKIRPAVVWQVEGVKINATAAIAQNAVVVWSQDDKHMAGDDWGDLAGVQFEFDFHTLPVDDAQLRLFTDYR